jgi:hypothetical protein
MRPAVEKIREICEKLTAAKGRPDYASTYQTLVAEAQALLENDPGRSDFMEAVYRYHPHFMASRLKKDREREQQERESTVPAA